MAEDVKILMPVNGKIFYKDQLYVALQECLNAGFRALFIPEIIGLRSISENDSFIWRNGYDSLSVKVTGATKGGNKVVVYAHIPNYFSVPKNITKAIKKGLNNGAGYYPQKEFEKLAGMADGVAVSVIDHKTAMAWPSGVYGISKPTKEHIEKYGGKIDGIDMIAMNNPHARAFIGQKNPEIYFEQYKKVIGNVIGVHYFDEIGVYHFDDLGDKPQGRVLFVNDSSLRGSLDGYNNLDLTGRFVGVPVSGAAGARKIASPLEQLVGKGTKIGNVVVIKQEEITPEACAALTQQ